MELRNYRITNKNVLVLGGYGFIGSNICKEVKASGANLFIGTRGLNRRKTDCDRVLKMHDIASPEDWDCALQGVDVVVNSVGILRERPFESFEQVHHRSVDALAQACADKNIKLIHISALGLDQPVTSLFSTSKLQGEHCIARSQADWAILRASLVEGDGAYGWSWFRRIAKWPVHFVPANHALIAPVNVSYLARAVVSLIAANTTGLSDEDRLFEVSNGINYSLPEYLSALDNGKRKTQIGVPDTVVRFAAKILDWLHLTPLSFGHYELLKYNNIPKLNALPSLLDNTDY